MKKYGLQASLLYTWSISIADEKHLEQNKTRKWLFSTLFSTFIFSRPGKHNLICAGFPEPWELCKVSHLGRRTLWMILAII